MIMITDSMVIFLTPSLIALGFFLRRFLINWVIQVCLETHFGYVWNKLWLEKASNKKPLNLWSWSYLAGPPPSFLRTVIALGYFFLRCFFNNWVIRYVLKQILVIFKTNLVLFYAFNRRNHFWEIRWERQDLYGHIYWN